MKQRLGIVLYMLTVVFVALAGFRLATRVIDVKPAQRDFGPYYSAALHARSGDRFGEIYEQGKVEEVFHAYWADVEADRPESRKNPARIGRRYVYPPLFAYVLIPFTYLPYDQARITWTWILFGTCVLFGAILTFSFPKKYRPLAALVLSAFFIITPAAWDNFRYAQINPVVALFALFGIVLSVYRRSWAGGAFITASIFLKPTSALLGFQYFFSRIWKVVLALLVAGVIIIAGSVAISGWQAQYDYGVYVQSLLLGGGGLNPSDPLCPSFTCYLNRAFQPSRFVDAPLAIVSKGVIDKLSSSLLVILTLSLSGIFFWQTRRKKVSTQKNKLHIPPLRFFLGSGLFLALPTMFQGLTQSHYLIYTVPLQVFLVLYAVQRIRTDKKNIHRVQTSSIIFFVLSVISFVLLNLPQPFAEWMRSGFGILLMASWFYALVILLVLSFWAVLSRYDVLEVEKKVSETTE